MKFSTIMVGYDGSETAGLAATEAAELARGLSAELHLVNVVDNDQLRQGMVPSDDQELAEGRASTRGDLLLAGDAFAGLTTHIKILAGPAAGKMIDYAIEVDADLIVVGNRRVQGIERLLGSVAIELLRHAPCSVYVAHTV
jgi:nucleotide-binding universal stress UspA family protein